MLVAEAIYLLGRRLGAKAGAAFLRGLGQIEIEPPRGDDWTRVAELVDEYGDLPWAAQTHR